MSYGGFVNERSLFCDPNGRGALRRRPDCAWADSQTSFAASAGSCRRGLSPAVPGPPGNPPGKGLRGKTHSQVSLKIPELHLPQCPQAGGLRVPSGVRGHRCGGQTWGTSGVRSTEKQVAPGRATGDRPSPGPLQARPGSLPPSPASAAPAPGQQRGALRSDGLFLPIVQRPATPGSLGLLERGRKSLVLECQEVPGGPSRDCRRRPSEGSS